MPLDVWRTLRPESGVARTLAVEPPDGAGNLLWTVAVELAGATGASDGRDELGLHRVGAAGFQRALTYARAAGETVERFALLPLSSLPDDPTAPALDAGLLYRDGPAVAAGEWCVARRLADGALRRVPAGVVDYAGSAPATAFEPTPSGAAAGPTREAAVCAALRELVEREVALVAWARQAAVPRIDLDRSLAGSAPARRALDLTRTLAAAQGVELVAALIPTGVDGADAVMAWALDRRRRVAAAGLAVCERTQDAVAKALQESLQVRCLLAGVRDRGGGDAAVPVRDDASRARWWTTPEAWRAATGWIRGLGESVTVAAVAPPTVRDDGELASDAQVERWLRRVPDALVVDLAPRLGPVVREIGWHAVKVLSPSCQPLVMDEAARWRWSRDRLELPRRCWAVRCGAPADVDRIAPHPFV